MQNERVNIQLFNQDCMEAMKEMPDKAFDLAIVDPPYGVGLKYNEYEDTQENFDFIAQNIIPEVIRVSKKAVIWCNHKNIKKFPQWDWLFCHAWRTTSNFGHLGYCQWQPMAYYGDHEKIGKNNNILVSDMYVFGANCATFEGKKIDHACPKPIKVYHTIINRFAKEGDVLLDPFIGSGSIAIACWDMGFDLTGYEIDADYFKAATERLERHKAQGQLF